MSLKERLHTVIFEADTRTGKAFDVTLLVFIVASIAIVMLESVNHINTQYGTILRFLEWIITIGFTIEYILRIYVVKRPTKYIFSFFGLVDLISLIPTYLGLFFVSGHYLVVVRSLRLLRVFRIFKLAQFLGESAVLYTALRASRYKISVFLATILMLVIIMGSVMYIIEGGQEGTGFTSIPRSVYWAIVTLTTVGYGDIAPQSAFGQTVAAFIMIMGYAVIAVPTGIVSVELNAAQEASQLKKLNTITCHSCTLEGHDNDAHFCKYCGESLHWEE